jgi:UDP:flavonoid glycosyltransferase YjiC (YdhE family)
MWRPGLGGRQLRRVGAFDLVIEPGELAADDDRGASAGLRDGLRVGPITLLDADEQVDRETAARALGVDPDRPCALVTLGAGNINDISSDLGILVARLMDEFDLQIVLTRPMIADDQDRFGERVTGVSVYPVSRYFRAVDMAIAASGYNAFHELVQFGVPTAFVPNTATSLDDQEGRARWAARVGAGLVMDTVTPEQADRVVRILVDTDRRRRIADRCADVTRPNGAGEAMAAVEALIVSGTGSGNAVTTGTADGPAGRTR